MPWAVVGAVGGALVASEASGSASDAQVESADRGVAETRRQFDKVQQMLMPFVNAATGSGAGSPGGFDAQAYMAANPDVANDRYYKYHPEEHWNDYGQFEGRTKTLVPTTPGAPQQMGALPAYLNLAGLGGDAAQGSAIAGIQGGAQFGALTKQGEDAILQNASATGGLRGGNAQDSLANFRSNLLSSLIDKQLGRYGGIIQLGQGSAAGVGNAAMATGQGVAGLMQQGGAAEAGGLIAGGRAFSDALGGVGGFYAGRGGAGGVQAAASQTSVGSSGFGTGLVYGNQDMGQYF